MKEEYLGGMIALTDASFLSPPRSLQSLLPEASTAIAAGVWPRTFLGNFTAVHCTVSVQVERYGADIGTIIVLKATSAGVDWSVSLAPEASRTMFQEPFDTEYLPALGVGSWTRIGIDVKLGQRTRVTFNDALVNSLATGPAVDAGGATTFTSVALILGAQRNNGPNGEWRVDYDDVVCSVDP